MSWLYDPKKTDLVKLSRSSIEQFVKCKRCFWLKMRHGVKPPFNIPFNINITIDELLKQEFDSFRAVKKSHPIHEHKKFKPFQHKKIDEWRDTSCGVQFKYGRFLIFGAVDDVWVDENGKLIVVDYKATSKDKPIKKLLAPGSYHDSYRRQMDVYMWLLERNGFKVRKTGYFVYVTILKSGVFSNGLQHHIELIPYRCCSFAWLVKALADIKTCLDEEIPPMLSKDKTTCEMCIYQWHRFEACK